MNTPHLLVSFAVAAVASAVELKDSTEVARNWEKNTAKPAPLTSDLGLRAQAAPPPLPASPSQAGDFRPALTPQSPAPQYFSPPGKKSPFQVPPWRQAPPLHPGTDIPDEAVPAGPDGRKPPGAKEWKYGGQTYWIVPLVPSQEK